MKYHKLLAVGRQVWEASFSTEHWVSRPAMDVCACKHEVTIVLHSSHTVGDIALAVAAFSVRYQTDSSNSDSLLRLPQKPVISTTKHDTLPKQILHPNWCWFFVGSLQSWINFIKFSWMNFESLFNMYLTEQSHASWTVGLDRLNRHCYQDDGCISAIMYTSD